MKIRKNRLRKIILEEISLAIKEQAGSGEKTQTDKDLAKNKAEEADLLKRKAEEKNLEAKDAKERASAAVRNIANSSITEDTINKITNTIFEKIKKAGDNSPKQGPLHLNKE
jgi:hypothetical protein